MTTPLILTGAPATTLAAIEVASNILGNKGIAKLSERLFDTITGKFNDEVDRLRRMQIAYTLIGFTAFFDTLEKELPEIKKSLKLKPSEKEWLSKDAIEKLKNQQKNSKNNVNGLDQFPDVVSKEIQLPHPIGGLDAQEDQLRGIYEELSKGFGSFLEKFAIWEKAKSHEKDKINAVLRELPRLAIERYEAQFFQLCKKYQEFYIWANLHERKEFRKEITLMADYVQEYVKLLSHQTKNIDIGMVEISNFTKLLPRLGHEYQANKTIEELKTLYKNRIEELVVKDIEGSEKKNELSYPKKGEIFIPQAFRTICYSGKSLEDEETWNDAQVRNDLGAFLIAFLSSPYSEQSPLIILGHPGSGKSLLSNIISARLINSPYTPIRVALRDVEADNEISVQIEKQIKKDTNRNVTWANLSDTFEGEPSLVIFDGYDELLQASGKVHAGYLRKVQKFQENEVQLGRKPVRTIVTSRITLIDKADIPENATIIRLKPFDSVKQEKWTEVWNIVNGNYFKEQKIKPFAIPKDENVLALAEQPLLLLMLAIYDSENNQLQNTKGLDQTILYDRLLRRFIRRELDKDPSFQELQEESREQEVEKEMERLGIVALGMFNRRQLHIKVSELNKDLSFFKLEKEFSRSNGTNLSQADLLLGSFFFVHESRSSSNDSETGGHNYDY